MRVRHEGWQERVIRLASGARWPRFRGPSTSMIRPSRMESHAKTERTKSHHQRRRWAGGVDTETLMQRFR